MSNNEILREFFLETHENLAQLDADLLTLEKHPSDKPTLAQVFRTLHSVKGTAGFMGLVKLQSVAHSAESLLSRMRAGELLFNPPIATALLRVVDAIREMLASIESSGDEGAGDYSTLIQEVDRLRVGDAINIPLPETVEAVVEPAIKTLEAISSVTESQSSSNFPQVSVALPSSDEVKSSAASDSAGMNPPDVRHGSVADTSIRVDVGLLDKLMTLVGELVLVRNQILKYGKSSEDDGLTNTIQRLNLLTAQLQASVMKTRMQPIGNVLNKFPRVVRDLAMACGKQVRFEMDGQETELDKTLLEAIRDPLTHMVRNAVDHGIETPAIRRSQGKPEEGQLRMVAFHEGGKVVIETTDDGAGIDLARVREKAIAAGIVSAEAIARMSRQEILRLVLLPGFSTSERVTQFSGRGVGMDVVRTNIEKIGGSLDIESTPGQGTIIRTKIPLTLTIIPALIIDCGGERFAIPQVSLLEIVRVDREKGQHGIESINGAPVYRLREKLLPLVFLDEQLRLDRRTNDLRDVNIIVLQADDRPFGLVIDAIRDTEEIVVKPLQMQLKGTGVFSGATIMGDGRVALVLDVLGLAQRSGVVAGAKTRELVSMTQTTELKKVEGEPLLLFSPRAGGQMAIPLSKVARLEEFDRESLERLGERQVVQYRGEILPLVDISQELDQRRHDRGSSAASTTRSAHDDATGDSIPVVVYAGAVHRAGLMVGRILDIVHDPIVARSPANRSGILFTAIVQDRVTEFVDVDALLRDPGTSDPPTTPTQPVSVN